MARVELAAERGKGREKKLRGRVCQLYWILRMELIYSVENH